MSDLPTADDVIADAVRATARNISRAQLVRALRASGFPPTEADYLADVNLSRARQANVTVTLPAVGTVL